MLCADFFQKWVPADADRARPRRRALRVHQQHPGRPTDRGRPEPGRAGPRRRGSRDPRTSLGQADRHRDGSVDRVFISNFFEHISHEAILATLLEVRRVLKPTGQLLLLQPNVRYCGKDYWQFFDHITPVDDRAMEEAFAADRLRVIKNIPRFLPYTTKSRLPSGPALVRLYLKVPLAWKVLGAQAFMVATPA